MPRSFTSIGIVVDGTLYLFDSGAGVGRRIMEAWPKLAALKLRRLGPVSISRLHMDHTLGLSTFLFYLSMSSEYLELGGGDLLVLQSHLLALL